MKFDILSEIKWIALSPIRNERIIKKNRSWAFVPDIGLALNCHTQIRSVNLYFPFKTSQFILGIVRSFFGWWHEIYLFFWPLQKCKGHLIFRAWNQIAPDNVRKLSFCEKYFLKNRSYVIETRYLKKRRWWIKLQSVKLEEKLKKIMMKNLVQIFIWFFPIILKQLEGQLGQ